MAQGRSRSDGGARPASRLRATPGRRRRCTVSTRSSGRSSQLRELVEEFGQREDVTPQAFGFCVEETPEGLRYRWAESSAVDTLEQLRRAGMVDDEQLERLRRAVLDEDRFE